MKTDSDRRRFFWFIGGLAVMAIVINSVVSSLIHPPNSLNSVHQEALPSPQYQPRIQTPVAQPQPIPTVAPTESAEAIERRRAAEEALHREAEAAIAHANFLSRYLNSGFVWKPGKKQVAIIAATTDGKMDATLASALAPHFKGESVELVSSLFKPAFVLDNLFSQVFDGSTDPLLELDLVGKLDSVILARTSVHYSTDPSLQNLVTANMQVEVKVVPVSANGEARGWNFNVNGAGFKNEEARQAAEERVLKEISDNTKLTIN
jgi:hypothetical protein